MVLFDIDGTLLLSGGAGSRALGRALKDIFGLTDGLSNTRPDGKTDPQIVHEVLARSGQVQEGSDHLEPLFSSYLSYLREELSAGKNFRVLPGVRELLARLTPQAGFLLGLATGNIEKGARMKLERAELSSLFAFGAFGSDAEDRTELIKIAIQRGAETIKPATPEDVIVIGDTPRDIVHGREAGAKTVAVAAGSYSLKSLLLYKPDLAIPSFEPIEPLLSFLAEGFRGAES